MNWLRGTDLQACREPAKSAGFPVPVFGGPHMHIRRAGPAFPPSDEQTARASSIETPAASPSSWATPAQIAQLRTPHLLALRTDPSSRGEVIQPWIAREIALPSFQAHPATARPQDVWSRRNLPIRPPEKLTHFWPPAAGRTWALLVRPYPLRAEVWGLLGALSVTVNVPAACPTRIALKRTTIEHCPPAASEPMHPLLVIKNWFAGAVSTLMMSMGLVPPLVSVKVTLLPALPGNPVK